MQSNYKQLKMRVNGQHCYLNSMDIKLMRNSPSALSMDLDCQYVKKCGWNDVQFCK